MQCGQRAALIGIDIVQAGQSLTTGLASGFGRFILLRARTIRKMQTAAIRKLMITGNEVSIGKDGQTRLLRRIQRHPGRDLIRKRDVVVGEVEIAEDHAQRRHEEIVHD